MSNTQKFKGIIFDLDGTLAFSMDTHHLAYQTALKPYGITYDPVESQEKYAGRGEKVIVSSIFKKNGEDISPEKREKIIEEKRKAFNQLTQEKSLQKVAGAIEFLDDCRKKNIATMVATGASRKTALRVLESSGLLEYFPEIVTVEDVENPKPAPDSFLLAAKKMGLKPEQCVVIEDAMRGVEAAKNGNFFCIGITTGNSEWQLKQSGADMIIEDYHDLQTKNIF